MSKLKEAALNYAAKGWPVFPCNANKQPYTTNGVLDATTNRKQIEEWWETWPNAGIAVDVGGAGMVVLDLDRYKPGYDQRAVEKALGGEIKATGLVAASPRGGEHHFYTKKTDEVIPPDSTGKLAKHADIRSFNSYVLLPPSRTKDGEYTWVSQGKPSFRPDQIPEAAGRKRDTSEDRDTWLIEADLPENIALCVDWLKNKAQIAVEGVNGDHMAYSTAAMCKSFGISPALALDLMWEHWNPRCSPPWSGDEIEHLEAKVRNGYSYNTSPPGNMTPAYKVARAQEIFKPVSRDTEKGGREIKGGRFRIVDRRGMDDIKPPEWLVKDAIPENSFALLIGPRGTFKTFIALDIALSIATGAKQYFGGAEDEWFGVWSEVASPGPVLFAAGEGRAGLNKRVRAWEKHHLDGDKAENFHLIDPVPGPNVDDVTAFIETALEMHPKGYRLCVLDTVGRAMQGLNENSQQDASMFTKMVEAIQHELGCAVLCLHHTGHGGELRARGSSVFGADVDCEFVLERKDKEHVVTLKNTKQKDAPEWEQPKVIQLIEKQDSLVAVAPAEKIKKQVEQQQSPEDEGSSNGKKRRSKAEITVELNIIRAAAYRAMKNAPGREFSNAALAQAIACDENVTVGAQAIRKRYLESLTTDKAHPVAQCYDIAKQRWIYTKK